jgi:periplasmic divalent cation tolerance protein
MNDNECVLVMTTLPADADGSIFAQALVETRLAACVNLLPAMESVYRWEGTVETERERQLIIKTTRHRTTALWERVRELHPYDVPEFIVVPILDGDAAYLRWVGESTRTSE